MGTSERIERERHAKRALIMDAARELFLERGYDAVTLRQIAERIEHSTTAIYVHFADKFDLAERIVTIDVLEARLADTADKELLGRTKALLDDLAMLRFSSEAGGDAAMQQALSSAEEMISAFERRRSR